MRCRPRTAATGWRLRARRRESRLAAAKRGGRLDEELERIDRLTHIIVDEVGHIPFDPEPVALFFALLVSRYERSSIVGSSNKALSGRAENFGCAVVVDCLVHHAEVLVPRGDSYRPKGMGKQVLQSEVDG